MKRWTWLSATGVLAGLVLGLGMSPPPSGNASAEDKVPAAKAKEPAAKQGPAANAPELLPMPEDPAFNRYVDLQLLGLAVGNLDPAGLTDAGLLMAEGERVLHRSHKNGLTAQHVLKKAATLAAKKHDKATLDRLARASEKLGDKELVSHVAAASKLADSPREADAATRVSVDEMTPAHFALLKVLHNQIGCAEFLVQPDELKAIQARLASAKGLPQTKKDAILRYIARSGENLPKEQSPEDAVLAKLAASTRGFLSNTPFDPGTWPDVDPTNGQSAWNTGPQIIDPQTVSGLWFRNNTGELIDVALEYTRKGSPPQDDVIGDTDYGVQTGGQPASTIVTGWFPVLPGRSALVLRGNLQNLIEYQTFYYFAQSPSGKVWAGPFPKKVNPTAAFTFNYRFASPAQRARWSEESVFRNFYRVNVGNNTNWTQNLNP